MIVMKFGGSSLADGDRIRHVAAIVENSLPQQPVVVLSAMGDTTDHLLSAAKGALDGSVSIEQVVALHTLAIRELSLPSTINDAIAPLLEELRSLLVGISLIRELTDRTKDYLVSFGERLSIRLVASYLGSIGIAAQAMDSWDAGFVSDSNFTSAEVGKECWNTIASTIDGLVQKGAVPVVSGFIAKDQKGNITTLGRGGSDLTATIIGAACRADEVQVWKDVDGIMTADPRLVKTARPVDCLTYDEAAELAYFGAQVLHPRSMQPCISTGTVVRVKNSYNPGASGTRIVARLDTPAGPVRAITSKKNVTLVDIVSTRMLGQHGFLGEVFGAFAKHRVSVDMVATSEVSISLTLDAAHDLGALKRDLERIAGVDIRKGKAIVTIVGEVSRSSEILEKAFGVCNALGVHVQMVSQGASKVNISFIVDDGQAGDVVQSLHALFFEGVHR